MSKQVKIKDNINNIEYTLEYNRNSIGIIEKQGFVASEFIEKPATMLPLAFKGAFMMHHSSMKVADVEKLFSTVKDKSGLLNVLAEMINDCYHSLMNNEEIENEDETKNVSWEIVE